MGSFAHPFIELPHVHPQQRHQALGRPQRILIRRGGNLQPGNTVDLRKAQIRTVNAQAVIFERVFFRIDDPYVIEDFFKRKRLDALRRCGV